MWFFRFFFLYCVFSLANVCVCVYISTSLFVCNSTITRISRFTLLPKIDDYIWAVGGTARRLKRSCFRVLWYYNRLRRRFCLHDIRYSILNWIFSKNGCTGSYRWWRGQSTQSTRSVFICFYCLLSYVFGRHQWPWTKKHLSHSKPQQMPT